MGAVLTRENQTLRCFMDALRGAGVKLTHQRLQIITELADSTGHPSVGEIYEAVRERIPSISLDTVYRTMRTLSGLGLIQPVGSGSERIRFDTDLCPHHHFVCCVCGEAFDFSSPELDALPVPEQARALGRVNGARVEVRGVCNRCLMKERKERDEG